MSDRCFWLVWRQMGGPPTVMHMDRAYAQAEAKRLAASNPGQKFWVMRAEACAVKIDVHWIEVDEEIPF